MARRSQYFLVAVVIFISINYSTVVTMNYHWRWSHLASSGENMNLVTHSTPSILHQVVAEWALTAQPWWGFAGIFDRWASPKEGRSPIRAWMGTTSFLFMGSVVSAAIYFISLFALTRFWKVFRRQRTQPAE